MFSYATIRVSSVSSRSPGGPEGCGRPHLAGMVAGLFLSCGLILTAAMNAIFLMR
jgi:hypothetical protein